MKIKMAPDDIIHGVRNSCGFCPVALCLNRVLAPHGMHVRVGCWNITVMAKDWRDMPYVKERFKTPPAVAVFEEDFDKYRHVHPIEFDLPLEDLLR